MHRWRWLSALRGTLLVLATVAYHGCGGSSGSGGSPPPAPTISSFTAAPAAVAAGGSSTLSWSVSNATSLSLDPGIGAVTGNSRSVSPAATTTYTLTATNASGSTTATATVTVVPPPVITSFTATPPSILAGAASTLAWTVSGATSLSLDQGIGVVTGTSRSVSPTLTTTYTLAASNAQAGATATATASATVTVTTPALLNFGEAPDGTSTGYPNVYGIIQPAQIGSFPTLLGHNGARTQSVADGILGLQATRATEAALGSFGDEDGLQNMVVVLTSIPPPAAITVQVTAPAGSSGGTMYLNVLFDKNMNGAWDGAGEWVVKNQAVTLPAAGTSVSVSPPAFAFANGSILPDPAWMRVALTREQVAGATWDGSGLFSSGEVEDWLVHLPALPGPPIKKVPVLTVQPGGPYTFPGGVGVLGANFVVSNWAPVAGTFTYALTKLSGNVALNLPWVPAAAPPIPIGPLNLATGAPATVAVAGNATSPGAAALPSQWQIAVDPVDPPAHFYPGGVYIGEGLAIENLTFSGNAAVVSHSFSATTWTKTHLIGISPCPDPFSPFIITNTGNVPLQWSCSSPPPWLSLGTSAGTIQVGGNATINPVFPCSGYALGPNSTTLTFTIQQSGTSTASTGPTSVNVSLTVN